MDWLQQTPGGNKSIALSDDWLYAVKRELAGTSYQAVLVAIDPYGDATVSTAQCEKIREALAAALARKRGKLTSWPYYAATESALTFLDEAIASRVNIVIVGD